MSLIERVEAAEVGDFGLDSDVHVSLNLTVPRLDGLKSTTLPPVTTSLDAALALAERVCPEALWSCVPGGAGKFCAGFHVPRGWGNNEQWGTAPTPALALCIAILKAKETK